MRANATAFAGSPALYYPYVEPRPQAGQGLVAALAARACVVVTDDFPCFFLPRIVRAAGRQLHVRLESIEGNGLIPLAAADRAPLLPPITFDDLRSACCRPISRGFLVNTARGRAYSAPALDDGRHHRPMAAGARRPAGR